MELMRRLAATLLIIVLAVPCWAQFEAFSQNTQASYVLKAILGIRYTGQERQSYEEALDQVGGVQVWNTDMPNPAVLFPSTPPGADTSEIDVQNAMALVADGTFGTGRAYCASSSTCTSGILKDWIPPKFGLGYGVKILSTTSGTTTANAVTSITGSSTSFTTQLQVGDSICLSSASRTCATVTGISSNTALTVGAALGNGTSQSIYRVIPPSSQCGPLFDYKSGVLAFDSAVTSVCGSEVAHVAPIMVNAYRFIGKYTSEVASFTNQSSTPPTPGTGRSSLYVKDGVGLQMLDEHGVVFGPYYGQVQDEGSDLAPRATINFAGTGVTCADGSGKTTCTVSGGGGGTVTAVTASSPLSSSGGSTPDVSLTSAVPMSLGGTNQTSWTASRCVQVNSGGTALEAAAAACGGAPEVQDETYNSTNFNGDTTHAVSQDDLYDQLHLGDADDDGLPDVLDSVVTITAAAAPSTPASGKGAVYVDSTSKNLAVKDDAGVVKHGVQTMAGSTSQWLRSVDDAGLFVKTQPAVGDVSGFGTNVAAWLATPTSSNFAAAVTGETGTGGVVFDTSPTIATPTVNGTILSPPQNSTFCATTFPYACTNQRAALKMLANDGALVSDGDRLASDFTLWGTALKYSGAVKKIQCRTFMDPGPGSAPDGTYAALLTECSVDGGTTWYPRSKIGAAGSVGVSGGASGFPVFNVSPGTSDDTAQMTLGVGLYQVGVDDTTLIATEVLGDTSTGPFTRTTIDPANTSAPALYELAYDTSHVLTLWEDTNGARIFSTGTPRVKVDGSLYVDGASSEAKSLFVQADYGKIGVQIRNLSSGNSLEFADPASGTTCSYFDDDYSLVLNPTGHTSKAALLFEQDTPASDPSTYQAQMTEWRARSLDGGDDILDRWWVEPHGDDVTDGADYDYFAINFRKDTNGTPGTLKVPFKIKDTGEVVTSHTWSATQLFSGILNVTGTVSNLTSTDAQGAFTFISKRDDITGIGAAAVAAFDFKQDATSNASAAVVQIHDASGNLMASVTDAGTSGNFTTGGISGSTGTFSGALSASNLSGTNTGDQTLPTGANPSGTVGLSAVNGSSSNFMRADAAPALSQSIVPTWTGVHTHSAKPIFNAGLDLGTSGRVDSNVADAAAAISFLVKPTVGQTSGTDRYIYALQNSAGSAIYNVLSNLHQGFGQLADGSTQVYTYGLPSSDTSPVLIGGSPLMSGAGTTIAGQANAVANTSFAVQEASAATWDTAAGAAFTVNLSVGRNKVGAWGAIFKADMSGNNGFTTTDMGGIHIIGNTTGSSMTGTITNWYGIKVENTTKTTNAYGMYVIEQNPTTGGTIKNGIFLANATSGYKAMCIRDQTACAGSDAAGYFDIVAGRLREPAGGASSLKASVGGAIFVSTSTEGNTAATETDACSQSIAASTLGADGDSVEFYAGGTFAVGAADRIKAKFGATTIFDSGALNVAGASSWEMHCAIIRTGAATQKATCSMESSSAALASSASYTAPAETLSGAITLKLTVNGTLANAAVKEMCKGTWTPAP